MVQACINRLVAVVTSALLEGRQVTDSMDGTRIARRCWLAAIIVAICLSFSLWLCLETLDYGTWYFPLASRLAKVYQ